MPAAAKIRATAKTPKATGRDIVCATAPVMNGAGSRVTVLNIDAEESPRAGSPGDWAAASAKPQGTKAPVQRRSKRSL